MSAPFPPQEPVHRSRSPSPFTEEIVRNLFDASQIPNDEIRRAVTTDATMVSNSVDQAQDPAPPDEAVVDPGQPTATTRKRAKYRQKKMLAGSTLYSVTGMPIDGINGCLVGVIAEFSNKRRNGGQYRVHWEKYSTSMPPTINKDLLRRWYPPEFKAMFDIAIEAYDEAGPAGVREVLQLSFSSLVAPDDNLETPAANNLPPPAATANPTAAGNSPPVNRGDDMATPL